MKRKMLAAREDLAKAIMKIAEQRGLTLYAFVNEVLEQAVRADAMGLTIKEIVNEHGVLEAAREAGFILVIERVWYDILERALRAGKRWMLKRWYETGRWYGKLYSAKRPESPLEAFREAMSFLTWNISELDFAEEEGEVTVRCISSRFTPSYTKLFSAFLEGGLNALGYESSRKEVSRGIIKLTFRRGE